MSASTGSELTRVPAGLERHWETRLVVDPTVERSVRRYVSYFDDVLPGLVTGFYVVGSVARGAYREGRSDIDFVAVVDREVGRADRRRLRMLQVRSGLYTAAAAIRRRSSPLAGTCNGVFVRGEGLPVPVSEISPVACQTGHEFKVGAAGSDLSPVAWKVLAEHAIAIRGPEPSSLPQDPQPDLLRPWNLGNLESYWRPWASAAGGSRRFRLQPRWSTAWGVLDPPRLHHTIATGEVISKEVAGEYALDVFPRRWHPLISDALAYWRKQPDRLRLPPQTRARLTSEFVLEVIDAASDLGSSPQR